MDKYDRQHKVGIIVDEWGTWYTCEPGTNPGFLYQQNTMRDAPVSYTHLHNGQLLFTFFMKESLFPVSKMQYKKKL